MADETSSPAAAATCVVDPDAAAFAATIDDLMPAKSVAAPASICGAATTYDMRHLSPRHDSAQQHRPSSGPLMRQNGHRVGDSYEENLK